MKKTLFYILITVLYIISIYTLWRLPNIYVSLKYETDSSNCISSVTGKNLCSTLLSYKIICAISFIGGSGLLIFRKKIVLS